MRLVMLLVSVLQLSLTANPEEKPKPCKSPPLMSGTFSFGTLNEEAWFVAPYEYDALLQRIRISDLGTYQNQSSSYNILLLYSEGVMYEINSTASTCAKKPLKTDLQPLGVPSSAKPTGQFAMGSTAAPGEGLLLNTWAGQAPDIGVKYMVTVTEVGCVPISFIWYTQAYGTIMLSFINTVKGLIDPNVLNPPSFCPGPEVQPEGPPVDFLAIIINMKNNAKENRLASFMSPF